MEKEDVLVSGGGTFIKVMGKCTSKKLWKIFFIKRFAVTMDPCCSNLSKISEGLGACGPPVPPPLISVNITCFCHQTSLLLNPTLQFYLRSRFRRLVFLLGLYQRFSLTCRIGWQTVTVVICLKFLLYIKLLSITCMHSVVAVFEYFCCKLILLS